MCKREHGAVPYRLYLIEARYLKAVAAAKIVSLLRDRMRRRRAQQERDALKRRAAAQEEKDKTTATRLVVTQCVAVLKKGRQCPNRTKEVSGGQLLCSSCLHDKEMKAMSVASQLGLTPTDAMGRLHPASI